MLRKFLAVAIAACMLVGTASAGVLIDDFSNPSQRANNDTTDDGFQTPVLFGSTSVGDPYTNSDVFTSRTIAISNPASVPETTADVRLSVESGVFSASTGVDLRTGNLNPAAVAENVIVWESPTVGSSSDVTDMGSADRFLITIIRNDPVTAFTLELFDINGSASSVTYEPGLVTLGDPSLILSISFDDFMGSGVNLQELTKIVLHVDQEFDADTAISSITTGTPEPASIAVWSILACCGLGFVKFRNKK